MAPPWPAEFRKTRRCKYFNKYTGEPVDGLPCPRPDAVCYFIHPDDPEWDHPGGRRPYPPLPNSPRSLPVRRGRERRDSSNDRSYRRRSPSSARSSTPPTPHQYRHPSRRDYSRSPGHHSPSPRRDRDGRPPPLSRSADSSDSVRHVAGPSGRDRTNSMASSVRSEPSSGHIPPPPPPIIQESLPTPMTAISLSPTTATSLPISQPPQATGLMHHPPSTLSATAPSEIPTPNPKGLQALSVVIPSSEPANRTGTQKETTAVASAVYAPLSAPFIPASTPAMAISASRSFTFEFAPPGQSTNTVTTNGDHVVTPGDLERADQHVRNVAHAARLRAGLLDIDKSLRETHTLLEGFKARAFPPDAQAALVARIADLERQRVELRNEYRVLTTTTVAPMILSKQPGNDQEQRTQVSNMAERLSSLHTTFDDVIALLPSNAKARTPTPPPKWAPAQIEERLEARRRFDRLVDSSHHIRMQHSAQADAIERRIVELEKALEDLDFDASAEEDSLRTILHRVVEKEQHLEQLSLAIQGLKAEHDISANELEAVRRENMVMKEILDLTRGQAPIPVDTVEPLLQGIDALQEAIVTQLQGVPSFAYSPQNDFDALREPVRQSIIPAVEESVRQHSSETDASLARHDMKWTEEVIDRVQRTLSVLQGIDAWRINGQHVTNGKSH